jgi:hypothetical protein
VDVCLYLPATMLYNRHRSTLTTFQMEVSPGSLREKSIRGHGAFYEPIRYLI